MTNRADFSNAVPALLGTVAALVVLTLSGPCHAYTEKTLYSFGYGSGPDGVVMDPTGNLFGVTSFGGKHDNNGVVFEFVPSTGQYVVLHNFCAKTKHFSCSDGKEPGRVNLVIDINGNLYGTTTYGGNKKDAGVVFELMRTDSGWREVTLYKFCSQSGCGDGANPFDGLTYAGAASGELYDGVSPLFGATKYGGTGGTAFSLTPQSGSKYWSEQVLYSFCSQTNCIDGTEPDTPLYIDVQGNIYGTTPYGGQSNEGVVFELSPGGPGYTESVLYSFCAQQNCADGFEPLGGVIMDPVGNLYGAVDGGGANNDGLIFELSPNETQRQFSDIADFDSANGASPVGALVMDPSGNLLGTTGRGGTANAGTVFEFNGSIQSLYSFCKKCDGTTVGVVRDNGGNLYGVTREGGQHNGGTLFELSP